MAIVRYVNTASTAGGDGTTNNTSGSTRAFATLLEAINSLPGTLTDQTTIYCEGTAADTSAIDQTPFDFATSATNYLSIVGNNRTGKWDTSKYRLEVTNSNAIYNNEAAHLRIDALQIKVTMSSGGEGIGIKTANANVSETDVDYRVSNCIVWGVITSGAVVGYNARPLGGSGAGTSKFWNCIAYDCSTGFNGEFVTTEFYNCTAVGNGVGFLSEGANGAKCVNCLASGNTNPEDFLAGGAFASGTSYNASSDATAPGSNSRTNQTFTFVNAGSDDYRLTLTDAGARNFGLSDPGSGLFSDDITGQTRTGSWDIGADEAATPTAALTGTAAASITEADIVTGGKTVILTLTDDTYVPATGTPTFSVGTTKGTTAADSAGGGGGRTGDGDLTCTFPSGYTPTAGHFALMILYNDQGDGSTPTDWAEITGSPWGSGTPKLQAFTKVLAGGESDPVSTISGSGTNISHCANIAIYTGVGSIGAVGTASAGTGSPMTAGAITTTANNSIVCAIAGRGDNENASGWTFNSSSTGVVERLDGGTGTGNDSQVSMADISIATSGSSSGNSSGTTSVTDPWVSVQIELLPSTPFTDARTAIRNGLDSAQSESGGWDAKVKPNIPVANVVRTSDTVCTITLQAQSDYDITATETITATIPAAALTGATQIVATPTFTITAAAGISPTTGHLTYAGKVPTVSQTANQVIAPAKGSLALTGYTPTILQPITVTPTTGTLTLTGSVATVSQTAHQNIAATTGHLTATGYAPGVERTAHQIVAPPKGALTLTGYIPTVAQTGHQVLTPTAGALSLTGYVPGVAQGAGQTLTPSTGHLTAAGYVPTVTRTEHQNITPTAGALTLTGYIPSVSQTGHQVIAPTVGHLTLTGYVPGVEQGAGQFINPSTGHLTATGQTPTVTQTGHQVLAPSTGHLTATGYAPTVVQPHTVAPSAGALTLTGRTPTVVQHITVAPSTGHLTLAGYVPTVTRTQHQFVAPATGHLTAAGYVPTVEQTGGQYLYPATGHATLTGNIATVTQTGHQVLTPSAGHATLTGYAPAVVQPIVVGPSTGHLTLTGYVPTLEQTAGIVLHPAAGHLTLAGYTPTIGQTGAVVVTPSVGHLTMRGNTPELVQDGYVAPSKGALILTGHVPRVIRGQAVPVGFPRGPRRVGGTPAHDVFERIGSAAPTDDLERIGSASVTAPRRRIG